jgi:hypothetical protein
MKKVFALLLMSSITVFTEDQAVPPAPKFNYNACMLVRQTEEVLEPHYTCTDLQSTHVKPKFEVVNQLNKHPECVKALREINNYISSPEFLKFAKANSLNLDHVAASIFFNDKIARAQRVKIQDTFVLGGLNKSSEAALELTGENLFVVDKKEPSRSKFIGHLNIDKHILNPSRNTCKVIISTDPVWGHGQVSASSEIDVNHPVRSMQSWLSALDGAEKQKIADLEKSKSLKIMDYGSLDKTSIMIEKGFRASGNR